MSDRARHSEMLYRTLGSTGEEVSAIGLGGWHLGLKHVDEPLSLRIICTAIDRGITFMDNSWDYNGGLSEFRMGKALRGGYRDRVFLMTKIDGRSKKAAAQQVEESLRRLRTDCIDLVQHHEVIRYEDPHRIFDEDGANAALVEARQAGKLRYIGFTGHKDPHIHLHMLEVARAHGFKFATAQMPLNVMDAHYRSFQRLVVPDLVREQIGVLGMKPMANGIILKSNTVTPMECLHYALNVHTSVVITGIDSLPILEQALEAARTYEPMSHNEVNALLSRTAQAAAHGEFEPFKTASIFDSTAQNPSWLGEEPSRLQELMPEAALTATQALDMGARDCMLRVRLVGKARIQQYSPAGMIGSMEVVILGLLALIAVLALVGRRLPVPYPVLLVIAGVLLSLIPGLPSIRLVPELIFLIFLPPLLYPAALFTSWRDFQANLRPILLLAVGLVLFTTIGVGVVARYFIPDLRLGSAFVLGAIVSPPDAIAASAIAEHLRLPRRIVTILEGESLVNDATALVTYRFAVAAVVTGYISWTMVTAQFVLATVGGVLIGLLVGILTTWIERRIEDPPIEITIALLTPFVAYLPADSLGFSGVLAVVTAGLYLGWRIPEITSSRTRLQVGPVWEMVEFLLNGFIFILIGLQLPTVLRALSGYSKLQLLWYASVVSLAVILVRILWVFPAAYLPRLLIPSLRQRDPYPAWQHTTLIAWTGMRGVVSLAAALALPVRTRNGEPFPGRDLILFLTFSVIVATLVIQGLSLPPFIRWLGLEEDYAAGREECEARLKANQAALVRLDELTQSASVDPDALQRLRAEYEDRIRVLQEVCERHAGRPRRLYSADYEELARETLKVERATLLQLRNQRVIND